MSNSLGVCGSYGPWDLLQGLTLPSVAPNTASGMVRAVQYLDLCSTEIQVVPEACTRQQKVVVSYGNAMHAVRTQCEVLDVGKYSNPSFGPFSQVFGSVPGFFWLPKHLGCGIFELSTISP